MLLSSGSNAKLRDLIKTIRSCRTLAEEKKVVAKELAFIRNSVKSPSASQYASRNAMKCIYLSLLGYHNVKFIHVTILNLVGSSRFLEKRVGYLGLVSLLLGESSDLFLMVTNTIWKDLLSSNQYIVGLALHSVSSICTPELARTVGPSIMEHLNSNTNPYILEKACAAAAAIAENADEFLPQISSAVTELIRERNSNAMLPAIYLIRSIIKSILSEGTQDTSMDVTQSWEILSTFMDGCFSKILTAVEKNLDSNSVVTMYSSTDDTKDCGLYLYVHVLKLLSYVCDIGAESDDNGIYHPTLIAPIRIWVLDNYQPIKQLMIKTKNSAENITHVTGKNGGDAVLLECVIAMNALSKHYARAKEEGNALSPEIVKNVFEDSPESVNTKPEQPQPARKASVNLLDFDEDIVPSSQDEAVDTIDAEPTRKISANLLDDPMSNELLAEEQTTPRHVNPYQSFDVQDTRDPELEYIILETIKSFMDQTEVNTRYATLSCLKGLVTSPDHTPLSRDLVESIVDMLIPISWFHDDANNLTQSPKSDVTASVPSFKLDEEQGIVNKEEKWQDDIKGTCIMFKSLDVIQQLIDESNLETLGGEVLNRLIKLDQLKMDHHHAIISSIAVTMAESLEKFGKRSTKSITMWMKLFSIIPYGILEDRYIDHVISLLQQQAAEGNSEFTKCMRRLENLVSEIFSQPEQFAVTDRPWYNHPQRTDCISLPVIMFYCAAIGMNPSVARIEVFTDFVPHLISHIEWRVKFGSSLYIANGIHNVRECVAINSVVDDEEQMVSSDAVMQAMCAERIVLSLAFSLVKVNQSDQASQGWKTSALGVLSSLSDSNDILCRSPVIYNAINEYHQLAGGNYIPMPKIVTTYQSSSRRNSLLDDILDPAPSSTKRTDSSAINKKTTLLAMDDLLQDISPQSNNDSPPIIPKKTVEAKLNLLNDLL